ncbi:MAG: Amuc_1102 family pilus-like protein, partial [Verrucomicrobiota bacterium]
MKALISTLAVLFATSFAVHAQNVQLQVGDVEVEDLEMEVQKTPDFEASGVKDKDVPNPRDWLEVEAKFKIDGRDDVVVPELLFRFYIGFKDQSGAPRVLTGDVTHKNMVAGEDYFSAVYVAPSTLG